MEMEELNGAVESEGDKPKRQKRPPLTIAERLSELAVQQQRRVDRLSEKREELAAQLADLDKQCEEASEALRKLRG